MHLALSTTEADIGHFASIQIRFARPGYVASRDIHEARFEELLEDMRHPISACLITFASQSIVRQDKRSEQGEVPDVAER